MQIRLYKLNGWLQRRHIGPQRAQYAGDIWSRAVRRGVCDSDLTERPSNCLVCRAGDAGDTTVC